MRTLPWILILLLASGCSPTLNDDDDAASDDDDATGDDDDATGDDDDATGDDDDDDDDTPPPYTPGVVFSGWYGECAGECRRDMSIGESDPRVSFVTSDWENTIYVQRAGILSNAGVQILSDALQTADPADVEGSYGCPGCDDGGVRQITWDLGPVAVSSQYEWGDPPPILLELVDVLSAIEAEIETCNYGDFFESIPDCDPVPG